MVLLYPIFSYEPHFFLLMWNQLPINICQVKTGFFCAYFLNFLKLFFWSNFPQFTKTFSKFPWLILDWKNVFPVPVGILDFNREACCNLIILNRYLWQESHPPSPKEVYCPRHILSKACTAGGGGGPDLGPDWSTTSLSHPPLLVLGPDWGAPSPCPGFGWRGTLT